MTRAADLRHFYALLAQLENKTGGKRTLNEIGNHRDWPVRGIYFFFDQNERRTDSGAGARVVRVGTHALTDGSRSTLRQRLGQHRGTVSGAGNHRGSIFRLLVGQALLASGACPPCASWGAKGDKRKACESLGVDRRTLDSDETPIEHAVSDYLAQLPFLWLAIGDAPSPRSLRGVVERNAIALLSNHARPPLDAPTRAWLGRHSNRDLVRTSGLWNQRHADETHDPAFLSALENLIDAMEAPS